MERKMLKEGEDADIEVTWEDQSRINEFSKLNARLEDLQARAKDWAREREYLEDLAGELDLVLDDEEPVSYRVGDFFALLPLEEAKERVAKAQESVGEEAKRVEGDMDKVQERMDELKVLLYGRFGKSINLDKGEDD
ncbi:putative GIM3-Gim complex component [Hyaloraphidium curvatum]|nr:putative GIM3-Gim complex component [Hyaloraphidium curvatum]